MIRKAFIVLFFPLVSLHKSISFGKTKNENKSKHVALKRLITDKEGMKAMKRNRKNSIKKERIIMIASSAFVLAALTMTGVYMKERNVESKDDGYSVDFAALEDSADNKFHEIAKNDEVDAQENPVAQNDSNPEEINVAQNGTGLTDNSVAQSNSMAGVGTEQTGLEQAEITNLEDDLDYMPMEAGSSLVEIPGLTDGMYTLDQADTELIAEANEDVESEDTSAETEDGAAEESEETSGQNVEVFEELHFSEADGLVRPATGDILMNYSMDGTIYFATLDQYKYNPAVIFSAEEGSAVGACAEGKVVDIYDDAQIGHAVTLDLGDGYQATYGQLENIQVTVGSYVDAGETIGSVAMPTKYFSVEGSNLYFQLTKDGEPINPENLF